MRRSGSNVNLKLVCKLPSLSRHPFDPAKATEPKQTGVRTFARVHTSSG